MNVAGYRYQTEQWSRIRQASSSFAKQGLCGTIIIAVNNYSLDKRWHLLMEKLSWISVGLQELEEEERGKFGFETHKDAVRYVV